MTTGYDGYGIRLSITGTWWNTCFQTPGDAFLRIMRHREQVSGQPEARLPQGMEIVAYRMQWSDLHEGMVPVPVKVIATIPE